MISVSFPIFKVDANKKIMDFNSKNPNVKFYKVGRKVFIEEAYYLSHGVKVLNVLDRLVEYLHIIKSINQKTKETNNE